MPRKCRLKKIILISIDDASYDNSPQALLGRVGYWLFKLSSVEMGRVVILGRIIGRPERDTHGETKCGGFDFRSGETPKSDSVHDELSVISGRAWLAPCSSGVQRQITPEDSGQQVPLSLDGTWRIGRRVRMAGEIKNEWSEMDE